MAMLRRMARASRPTRALSGSDRDAARADADLQFALHLKQIFSNLRVEYPEAVDSLEDYVVAGAREARPPWKFFFDSQSGFWCGLFAMPNPRSIARAGSRSTIHIGEIQQNVPIDDEKFRRPSAKTEKSSQAASAR